MKYWKLPSHLISSLRNPLGELYLGEPSAVWHTVLKVYNNFKSIRKIITVGDIVSYNFISHTKLLPDLMIIDGRSLRKEVNNIYKVFFKNLRSKVEQVMNSVNNPAGTITEEVIQGIKKSLSNGRSLLIVNGEEDLCAIPAVMYAPLQSLLFYGQPEKGVVALFITEEIKARFIKIFQEMEEYTDGN